jgi:hypothetical protein
MKVPKNLLGKRVEVHWWDPKRLNMVSSYPTTHEDVPRGRKALAQCITRGVIEFVDEDVVTIQKFWSQDPKGERDPEHSLEYDNVPESLIFRIIETPDAQVHGEPLGPPADPRS